EDSQAHRGPEPLAHPVGKVAPAGERVEESSHHVHRPERVRMPGMRCPGEGQLAEAELPHVPEPLVPGTVHDRRFVGGHREGSVDRIANAHRVGRSCYIHESTACTSRSCTTRTPMLWRKTQDARRGRTWSGLLPSSPARWGRVVTRWRSSRWGRTPRTSSPR